ncbi:MAG: thioredoxin peroxidase [Euryarchaeota archaeon RBG_13_31_8]|nr:MAG: thioredoxin peroxidase [Euryarchaeota archaeon RBG_13_31_8]
MEKKCFKVGEKASDFELFDQNNKKFRLLDFKGKRVLLSFHPLAWTSVCAKQMQSLEKNFDEFKKLNTIAVGINIDSIPSKNAWAKTLNIKKTKLLSDFWPHGQVAQMYGVFREKDGFSDRANIIINENQELDFIKVYEISELPEIKEILTYLEEI